MAGKLSILFELEMPEARAAGAKAARDFVSGFGDALKGASATFRAMNPHLFGNVLRPPIEAHGPQGIQKSLAMGELFKTQVYSRSLQQLINQRHDIGVQGGLTGQSRRNYEAFWKGAIEAAPKSPNWSQILLGAAIAPFSPWIGARGIAGGMSGGGSGGGVGNALFGGSFGKFEAAFLGINIASKVFEHSVEMFKAVVTEGFHLYTRAAQTFRTVGQLFSTEQAAKQVGISVEAIDQYINRINWGRAKTSLQNFGVQRQSGSLSDDYQNAYKWASEIQGTWEMNARKTYEIQVNFERIKTDWLTMWNDSSFLSGIDKLLKWTDSVLHSMNATDLLIQKNRFIEGEANASGLNKIPTRNGFGLSRNGLASGLLSPTLQAKVLALFEKDWQAKIGGGQMGIGSGSFQMPAHGAWERMGLILGTHKADSKELQQLKEHTKLLGQIAYNSKPKNTKPSGIARFNPA